ncbi:guanylate kinase [Persephonella sp.]
MSSPAGGGKTTLSKLLLQEISNLTRIITCTTRKPRPGEKDGVDYIFLTKEKFERLIKENAFLEYAVVHGNYYGTPKNTVLKEIEKGNDVLLIIDVQGMRQIKSNMDNVITIFLIPPSLEELINRMKKRGDTEEEIKKRLETAKKEFPAWKEYDYIVINDVLEEAKEAVKRIILSNRYKKSRFDIDLIKDTKLKELMKNG